MIQPAQATGLRIGELALASGVSAETIRFYEREGVLPAPRRGAARYREYAAADVDRVAFVRTARELGFTLTDVRALLSLADTPGRSCADVDAMARAHLSQVEEKLHQLESLRDELTRVIGLCEGGRTVVNCKILRALGDSARHHERAAR